MSRIIPSHWGQQKAFRLDVQGLADRVFGALDVRLAPRVVLVGVVLDHEDGVYPLFLDASGDASMTALFQEAARRSKAVRQTLYAEAQASSGRAPEGDARRRLVLEAWRRSVEDVLSKGEGAADVISFCSEPRPVNEFLVCTVLRLRREPWRSHFSLRKDEADERERRPASLLDATVEQFMRRCAVGLAERHAGLSASILDSDPGEILRAAGRLVTDAPALGGQRQLKLQGLWHACNTISSLRYEGAGSQGELILSGQDHPGVVRRVALRRRIPLSDAVGVRKLLETHQPGYGMLSDGAEIHGLGHQSLDTAAGDLGLFSVAFRQHYTWELSYGPKVLMRVSYGLPSLPETTLREAGFRTLLRDSFGEMPAAAADALWRLSATAMRQGHGALVVVTPRAVEEAERLGRQAAPIDPTALDAAGILALTSVDGALLADPQGRVHAFGVILDGQASARGNPARGARYNATLRYVDSATGPCLAVVVSEDGSVDLVTNAAR